MRHYDYDLLTIGAGSGGVAASRRAASYGAKVAICEDRAVGGTCVLRGCVPKKLLVMASMVRSELDLAAGFGWDAHGSFDWSRLIVAKRAEIERLEHIYERMLGDARVEILRGRGVLVDPHTVEIDGREVTAARILVATGGRPWLPGIPGIEHAMNSDDALDRQSLPARVVIVGGGYIAVEFAGIYRGMGSEVVMLVRGEGILRGFDDDVRTHLQQQLALRGIEIVEREELQSITATPAGLQLQLAGGAQMAADAVLVATGRVPNTEGIGLHELGIEVDTLGRIPVDEWSRTSQPSVFAIGDVTARPQLTPMAIADGRAFADSEFGGRPRTVAHEGVASAVFSQPPCGVVGLTEAQARARGAVRIYRTRFRPMKQAFAGSEKHMMMKLVVDDVSDRVLGVHIVGPDAPEMVQGFAVAVRCGATKAQFDATLAIHPTAAEELVTMAKPVA
ncbi:MAG: glutathione-disulfide reductase [Deltaproteobacteria bacterium]|nr:glutathione-disulfide reductase [Deltaproteobacteria bacterium]